MKIDAQELTSDTLLETDVCIIGSGPAGLALALSLIERGRECILLESGIDRFSPEHQALGELDSDYKFGNLNERQLDERRQIGGKSNAWSIESELGTRGVRLLPYHAANFAARPAMGGIAWPFDRQALDPFYAQAAAFFDIENSGWERAPDDGTPLTGPLVEAKRFRFSDGEVLTRQVRDKIAPSDKVRLVFNATALSLDLNEGGTAVSGVRCASAPGKHFSIKANKVVVAGGGLATTGLLLRSNTVQKNGIGNQNDLLGRYFMDHPLVDGGQLVVRDRAIFDRAGAYDLKREGNGLTMTHLQMRDEIIRNEPVANICAMLYPRPRVRNLSQAYQDDRRKAQAAWHIIKDRKGGPFKLAAAGVSLALHAPHVLEHRKLQKEEHNARINRGGWSTSPGASSRYAAFDVLHICEQAPNFENRVLLGNDRDQFGEQRVKIHWTWTQADKEAVVKAQALFVKTFQENDWGEYRLLSNRGEPEIVHSSLGHHIGTTRMHSDPKQGVTDGNAKVHGVDNLYVASSSLFPSGGWENPTLTVVALAFRLADHIAQQK